MTRPRARFTIGQTLVAIGALAVLMGVVRQQSFAGIFAVCVAFATYTRSRDSIERQRLAGKPASWRHRLMMILTSLVIATTILGLCDLVFLIGNWIGLILTVVFIEGLRSHGNSRFVSEFSVLFGMTVALMTAKILEARLWRFDIRGDQRPPVSIEPKPSLGISDRDEDDFTAPTA